MDSQGRTAIHLAPQGRCDYQFTVALLSVYPGVSLQGGELPFTERNSLGRITSLVALALLIQVCLGLSNIIWHLPLAVGSGS